MDSKQAYNRHADIIEITLKDCTGRKQDRWIASLANIEEVARIIRSCINKCGLNLIIKESKENKKDSAFIPDMLGADEAFKW